MQLLEVVERPAQLEQLLEPVVHWAELEEHVVAETVTAGGAAARAYMSRAFGTMAAPSTPTRLMSAIQTAVREGRADFFGGFLGGGPGGARLTGPLKLMTTRFGELRPQSLWGGRRSWVSGPDGRRIGLRASFMRSKIVSALKAPRPPARCSLLMVRDLPVRRHDPQNRLGRDLGCVCAS